MRGKKKEDKCNKVKYTSEVQKIFFTIIGEIVRTQWNLLEEKKNDSNKMEKQDCE